MSTIKETTLHPDGNEGVDLYPKTNINQVQELPQKLTSIENQIGQLNINKLTKPVTPTTESAVTMLADGTVGTKPLSEIGGGGGKLYLHRLSFNAIHPDINSGRDIEILVERYSSNGTPLTSSDFQTLFPVIKVVIGTVKYNNGAICAISCAPTGQILSAVLYYPSNTPDAVANKEGSGLVLGVDLAKITESTNPPAHRISFSSDTVTEL